jgi:hypothetical protein
LWSLPAVGGSCSSGNTLLAHQPRDAAPVDLVSLPFEFAGDRSAPYAACAVWSTRMSSAKLSFLALPIIRRRSVLAHR